MSKIKGFFKNINHRHYVALGLIFVSVVFAIFRYELSYIRLWQSCVDLYHSFIYYICATYLSVEDKLVTVTLIPDIDLAKILPFDLNEFLYKCEYFGDYLFSGANFRNYSMAVLFYGSLALSILSLLIPLVMLIISRVKALYLSEGEEEDKYKDTRPLQFFKARVEPKLMLAYLWLRSFISFLLEKRYYLRLLIFIWLLNLNAITLLISLVSYYLYFMSSFEFASFPGYFLKLLLDLLLTFTGLPLIAWLAVIYLIITSILKKIAYSILEHHEMKNRGFINAQPLGVLGCCTMGGGKTTLITDMGLSNSVMFKNDALDILIRTDLKFPNFPWLKLEDDLKRCYENHIKRQEDLAEHGSSLVDINKTIFNLSSTKYYIVDKYQKFIDNPCKENLWGYDFEKYKMEHDDDLTITDLFVALITYSKAYLVYITQCSLIFANYSIREDMYCDDGYFPLWCTDFFHRTPRESELASHFAKIIDFDMLRLGKKMVELNAKSGAFEFGVICLTEIGKERGNSKENREMKKKDAEANPTNDGTEDSIKMIRHRAMIDFKPFVRILSEEQRPDSLGANTRDTFSVIQIVGKSDLKVLYKGLFFDGFVHDVIYPHFRDFYLNMRNLRGDNTLLVYILKNIFSWTETRYSRLENRFGYYVYDFETTIGKLDGVAIESKYYLSRKKAYSDRFASDCYGEFFEEMSYNSGIGMFDFIEYQALRQTREEMALQNSYFYLKMSEYTQFADA
ncbi:MAG: hypothetical protein IJF11_02165 [Clostridia bacterium]|nr:hypothetical protein [Clostridia bacterium]